jgi:hypothetical protein
MRDPRYRYTADFEYWLRVGLHGPMARIPQTLATWRRHSGAASQACRDVEMAEEHVELIERFFARPDLPAELQGLRQESLGAAHFMAGELCCQADYHSACDHYRKCLACSSRESPVRPGGKRFPLRRYLPLFLPETAYHMAQFCWNAVVRPKETLREQNLVPSFVPDFLWGCRTSVYLNALRAKGLARRVLRPLKRAVVAARRRKRQIPWEANARLEQFIERAAVANPSGRVFLVHSHVDPAAAAPGRSMRLACEAASEGIAVVYVCQRDRGEIEVFDAMPGVLAIAGADVSETVAALLADARWSRLERVLVMGSPLPSLIELVHRASVAGWRTVYDAAEDWRSAPVEGKGAWYDPAVERYLGNNSDLAIAPSVNLASLAASVTQVKVRTVFDDGLPALLDREFRKNPVALAMSSGPAEAAKAAG